MMSKIFQPPLGTVRPEFWEERDAWRDMVDALGADRQMETHDKGCRCGESACRRLLAVRRYVAAHVAARRVRISAERLQAALTEFVEQYNAADVDLAHETAVRMVHQCRNGVGDTDTLPRVRVLIASTNLEGKTSTEDAA